MDASTKQGKEVKPVDLEGFSDIVRYLVLDGVVSREKVVYADKVAQKLDTPQRLLDVLKDLGFVNEEQLRETLAKFRDKIRIGSLLVDLGYISERQLDVALTKQRQSKPRQRLGEVLVGNKYISDSDLVQVLSMHLGFPYVEVVFSKLDKKMLNKESVEKFQQHRFLPVPLDGGEFIAAMADPLDREALQAARAMLGPNVPTGITTERLINESITAYQNLQKAETSQGEVNPNEIKETVNKIILEALQKGASDIHVEPMKNRLRIRLRKDGFLMPYVDLPKNIEPSIINRLKVMAGADITEKRRHQEGRIVLGAEEFGLDLDIRISFYVTFYGEKVVLRLLVKKSELYKVDDLGMGPKVLERFKEEVLDLPTGVVIITGPTGAGKTTTLYAAINHSNRIDTHIITAEDPVEYVIEGVSQCTINPKLGVTFEETLRHILRQDPDIIVLGEIRDRFSAESAIQAALTGHKVLTTFHTEDTIGGLLRLMNMDIETFLISSTVVSVVAQRLIRRVCPHCSEPYSPSPRDLRRLQYQAADLADFHFCLGSGCEACDYTGYRGRVGVFELLVLNEYVKEAILARRPSSAIRRICLDTTGLVTLVEDGLIKAARGVTSLQEVIRQLPLLEKPRPLDQIFRLTGE